MALPQEKKKHCDYSSSDTSYPTSAPTSDSKDSELNDFGKALQDPALNVVANSRRGLRGAN